MRYNTQQRNQDGVEDQKKVINVAWNGIDNESLPVLLTPKQRAELDRRIDAYEEDPDDLLTWDEVLEQLRGGL